MYGFCPACTSRSVWYGCQPVRRAQLSGVGCCCVNVVMSKNLEGVFVWEFVVVVQCSSFCSHVEHESWE